MDTSADRFVDVQRCVGVDRSFTEFNDRRSFDKQNTAIEHLRLGGATALRDGSDEPGYYNRVFHFGESDLAHLPALAAFYHAVGCRPTISLTSDRCSPALMRALGEQGYSQVSLRHVFAMPCGSREPQGDAPLHGIRRAEPSDLEALISIWWAEETDELPSAALIARCAAAQFEPEFPIYLIECDGRAVSMASFYMADGVAWLGNASTLRSYRGRGFQRALLEHRLDETRRMGCEWALSDADFGSTSHRNILRVGMELAYVDMSLRGPEAAHQTP